MSAALLSLVTCGSCYYHGMSRIEFSDAARLPAPGDNCAIAVRRLEASTELVIGNSSIRLSGTLLEGHRFAVREVANGDLLRSWGRPFGVAIRELRAGDYVCNVGILEELRLQEVEGSFPSEPSFADLPLTPFQLDDARFQPTCQVAAAPEPARFEGYPREGGRGAGTRNFIVLLATSSRTAGFVRPLAAELALQAARASGLDGVVAVSHTEGGGASQPNNLELVLRSLAGFMVHPNVAAVLAIDQGEEAINNRLLEGFTRGNGYPLGAVAHGFVSLGSSVEAGLEPVRRRVKDWLEQFGDATRSPVPARQLKVALQCGGSDAFSGISGNPLAGWVAREVIRHGGAANLAETDELIGAEGYILERVRDLETARRFLRRIERFKALAAWHGQSAEGNPSGGNRLRGLYNITLKSIGAATKKPPDVALDWVIDYGERMTSPGFYFMDSPGNDLESVGGQVATGANLILFTTGNGSITNFPFVPTVKIVTTSSRYRLLRNEMDVNAGAILEGTPLDTVGRETFDLALEVASGRLSQGERAGHYQVSIWRNWGQGGPSVGLRPPPVKLAGRPVPVRLPTPPPGSWTLSGNLESVANANVGLILPTSLCAGQVARIAAERLNRNTADFDRSLSRFVALVHTEGCGVSGGSSQELFGAILLGYLTHPMVGRALLLEHGCEKTHNAFMRELLLEAGLEPERFGFASIQRDGGIESVLSRIASWFGQSRGRKPRAAERCLGRLTLGIDSVGEVSAELARAAAEAAAYFLSSGGMVIVPEKASFLSQSPWSESPAPASLAFAQPARLPGLHVMQRVAEDPIETLTGLGAAGAHLLLRLSAGVPLSGHPLIPLLHVGETTEATDSLDLVLEPAGEAWGQQILTRLGRIASNPERCRALARSHTDFQITRGPLGVSL